jgi:D-lyxose ketol-isomerase
LILKDNQLSPMHRHIIKAEDIINRGGGDLVLEIHAPDPNGGVDRDNPMTVPSDACPVTLQPQEYVRLKPRQSVTLMPGIWHAFRAERGDCLIGEVSTVNNDRTDIGFEKPIPRFSKVEKDSRAGFPSCTRLLTPFGPGWRSRTAGAAIAIPSTNAFVCRLTSLALPD